MSYKECIIQPSSAQKPVKVSAGTAFGCARDFMDNRFVYVVVSPRAKGLSIGVNMNPDKMCNFDCSYCEVNRLTPTDSLLDVDVMAAELQRTLGLVRTGRIREHSLFGALPDELLQLKHVALSGDGEPTLAPNFTDAVQGVMHVRACSGDSFFKVVLISNSTGLDLPDVQSGLRSFTRYDEVWAKLEAGTQEYMNRISGSTVSLEKVLTNILLVSKERPVIIQSLFPSINGKEPTYMEIDQYVWRLKELKEAGAQIPLVQIYSATRPMSHSECGHLPLRTLHGIAQKVKLIAGLKAEVF
ncbi:MAG: radical SAM protein [Verrucomicrobia bacterium]|nr:radical SAM protein [Verrucomicrobiota bacterium]